MRRFLYFLGAFTLAVVIVAVVGLGAVFYKGHELDTESKAFVDSAIPAITATWKEKQLLDRSTIELRETVKPDELRSLFDRLSQLGPLIEYQGATGQAIMSYLSASGSTVSASYSAKARFQNGSATLQVLLLKRDGHWLIHNFHVDPASGAEPGGQRT
jgi:hypothetical protein